MNADKATSAITRVRELIAEAETSGNVMLPEICDAMHELVAELELVWAAMIPALRDVCTALVATVTKYYIRLQRAYLHQRLGRWLPDRCAWWLSEHWPESSLPRIDFERLTEGEM